MEPESIRFWAVQHSTVWALGGVLPKRLLVWICVPQPPLCSVPIFYEFKACQAGNLKQRSGRQWCQQARGIVKCTCRDQKCMTLSLKGWTQERDPVLEGDCWAVIHNSPGPCWSIQMAILNHDWCWERHTSQEGLQETSEYFQVSRAFLCPLFYCGMKQNHHFPGTPSGD